MPYIQPTLHNKYHLHAHACMPVDSPIIGETTWKLEPKIDQITHSLWLSYLAHVDNENGPAEKLVDLVSLLIAGGKSPSGVTGYHLRDDDEMGSQYYAAGLTINGHLVGRLGVNPVMPYKTMPWMKLELYVAEIQRLGFVSQMEMFLDNLFSPELRACIFKTRVSRIDFALDFEADIGQYWFLGSKFSETDNYSKKTTTQYFGAVTSLVRFRIYNKKAHLLDRASPVTITAPHLMRVEITLRGSEASPNENVFRLKYVKNRWLRIRPILASDLLNLEPSLEVHENYLRLQQYGLNRYLASMSEHHRKGLRKRLHNLPYPAWWNPEKLWEECLGLLHTTPFVQIV